MVQLNSQFDILVISVTATTASFVVPSLAVTSTRMNRCRFWSWTAGRWVLHHVAGRSYGSCNGDMARLRMCSCWRWWCRVVASAPTTSSLIAAVCASACSCSCNSSGSNGGGDGGGQSSCWSCHNSPTVATFLFTTFLWLLCWLCPTVILKKLKCHQTEFLRCGEFNIQPYLQLSQTRTSSPWISQSVSHV